jgi:MFS family permease
MTRPFRESVISGDRKRWLTLVVVCLAVLMNVLDASIVNVALPTIQRSLHMSQANLTWVVNAYLITYGGFLLLAGRVGDLIGRKRVFLVGIALFTAASAVCGASSGEVVLIVARFVQGFAGALSSSSVRTPELFHATGGKSPALTRGAADRRSRRRSRA